MTDPLARIMPDGLPLFILDEEATQEQIATTAAEMGFETYYIVGVRKPVGLAEPCAYIYKNVSSLVTRSLSKSDSSMGLPETLWAGANFKLPPIPTQLRDHLDTFFRNIDDRLHTESIVLLTYRPSMLTSDHPGDGWGVLVPTQENSAGHCDYDGTSIVNELDDDTYIVGSMHSHPQMGAFASGTDHHDQEEFDGLHITQAWRGKSKTDYYAELQAQGVAYTLDVKYVFDGDATIGYDTSMWESKVTKRKWLGTWRNGGTEQYKTDYSLPTTMHRYTTTPPSWFPNTTEVTVVTQLLEYEGSCPVCYKGFGKGDQERRRCSKCMNYIALAKDTYEQFYAERIKAVPHSKRELEIGRATLPIVFIVRNRHGGMLTTQKTIIWDPEAEPDLYGDHYEPMDHLGDGADAPMTPGANQLWDNYIEVAAYGKEFDEEVWSLCVLMGDTLYKEPTSDEKSCLSCEFAFTPACPGLAHLRELLPAAATTEEPVGQFLPEITLCDAYSEKPEKQPSTETVTP